MLLMATRFSRQASSNRFCNNLHLTFLHFSVHDSINLRHHAALVGSRAVEVFELLGVRIHHMSEASPFQKVLDLAFFDAEGSPLTS